MIRPEKNKEFAKTLLHQHLYEGGMQQRDELHDILVNLGVSGIDAYEAIEDMVDSNELMLTYKGKRKN